MKEFIVLMKSERTRRILKAKIIGHMLHTSTLEKNTVQEILKVNIYIMKNFRACL